jgi:hypothetical protein
VTKTKRLIMKGATLVFFVVLITTQLGVSTISSEQTVDTSLQLGRDTFSIYSEGNTGTLIVTLSSGPYTLTSGSDGRSTVSMEGYSSYRTPDQPQLPTRTYLIGLPPGTYAIHLDILDEQYQTIPGFHILELNPPISDDQPAQARPQSTSDTSTFPSSIVELLGNGQLRKYHYARIRFTPITYTIDTYSLTYYTKVTLQITYQHDSEPSDRLLQDNAMDSLAQDLLYNYPSIKPLYTPTTQSPTSEQYDYLIITPPEFEPGLYFFKNWKELIGHSVNIVTTTSIYNSTTGRDHAEQIRNFLVEHYIPWGVTYVLLVGTHELIPMRYCYGAPTDDDAMPTDYYYADLTSDWDTDNDGIYGELEEGENPDFTAEVWVGRLPATDVETVQSICQKTINFERDSRDWKHKALLIGAIVNFKNEVGLGHEGTDGAVPLEIMWNNIIQPAGFSRFTLYEQQGLACSTYASDVALTREHVLDYWPEGYGLVNWVSHGTPVESIRKWWDQDKNLNNVPDMNELERESFIASSDCFALNEEKPSIVFGCACSNGDPEEPNNLGKSLLENGAVAFIGATHPSYYNFGWNEINDGGIMSINYFFLDNLLSSDQGCGEALYNALFHCWSDEDIFIITPNIFVFALYGDPSLSFKSYTSVSSPLIPSKPAGEKTLAPDRDYTFSTSAVDPDGNALYYIWDWGDGTLSDLQGPFVSEGPAEASHAWSTSGEFMVRVKAISIIGDESDWSEPLILHVTGPVIEIGGITGGLKVNVLIKNTGDAEAQGVTWNISFYGGSIFLGRNSYGTVSSIPAGGQITVVSRFVYGFGLPTVIIARAGIPGSSSDSQAQSAEVMMFFVRIT